jgi:hypothetical protein
MSQQSTQAHVVARDGVPGPEATEIPGSPAGGFDRSDGGKESAFGEEILESEVRDHERYGYDHRMNHTARQHAFLAASGTEPVRGRMVAQMWKHRLRYARRSAIIGTEPCHDWRGSDSMATAELGGLITAERFAERPDPGYPDVADEPPRMLATDAELILPGVLDDFHVRVARFFE